MTLEQWLQEATGTFPPGVRERLAQEYTAHLEDSVAAGGSRDALELFGKPRETEKALKNVYINSGRIFQLRRVGNKVFGASGITLVSSFIFLFHINNLSQSLNSVIPILIAVWAWIYSNKWQFIRQAAFRTSIGLLILFIYIDYSFLFGTHNLPMKIIGGLQALSIVSLCTSLIAEDKRIRRTLELEHSS